jgi:biopolymer transport protein ExbD
VSLRRRHSLQLAFINLTPLIDMAMMLVVFFVLGLTTSAASVTAVPVSLPRAGSADAAVGAELQVVVERGGTVRVDGRVVELAELQRLCQGRHRAVLLADRDSRHGRVVDVIEALRAGGIEEVSYATSNAPSTGGHPLQDW